VVVAGLVLMLASSAVCADAKTLRIPVTSFDVAPESDRNPCEYVALKNDEAMDIRKFARNRRRVLTNGKERGF